MRKLLPLLLVALLACDDDADRATQQNDSCYLKYYKEDDSYSFDVSADAENRIIKVNEYRLPGHSEYGSDGSFLSSTSISYTATNEVKIIKTFANSENMSVVKLNDDGNPVEYPIGNDNRLLQYDSNGKLVRQTIDGSSRYEYTYDAAGKNITKIVRYLDDVMTHEVTVNYDNKRNVYNDLWVLAASTGVGYFDDIHIYFTENNPIKYSFDEVEGDDFELLIDYEYNDLNFPIRAITEEKSLAGSAYTRGEYTVDCK